MVVSSFSHWTSSFLACYHPIMFWLKQKSQRKISSFHQRGFCPSDRRELFYFNFIPCLYISVLSWLGQLQKRDFISRDIPENQRINKVIHAKYVHSRTTHWFLWFHLLLDAPPPLLTDFTTFFFLVILVILLLQQQRSRQYRSWNVACQSFCSTINHRW